MIRFARRAFARLVAVLALAGAAAAAPPDPCLQERLADGWCDHAGAGYVANVAIPSRLLWDVMDAHGHVLDLTTVTCPACKAAIESDGFCDEHRTGFVRRLAYFSRLTYEMARGERKDPASIRCADCRRNAETTGWCARHRTGMIGNVAIVDRAAYDRAAKAVAILRAAVAMLPRCEGCAVAMVTDTECWPHRIPYVNGVAQPPTGPPRQ